MQASPDSPVPFPSISLERTGAVTMKFYQKRGFALVVLILAIIGSGVYGISKKPASPARGILLN